MAKKKDDDVIDAGAQFAAPAPVEASGDSEDIHRKVKIRLPIWLKINGVDYAPGVHTVEAHVVDTMMEMVDKKRRADLAMFTGKNILIERLLDNTLVQREVEQLDGKTLVGR